MLVMDGVEEEKLVKNCKFKWFIFLINVWVNNVISMISFNNVYVKNMSLNILFLIVLDDKCFWISCWLMSDCLLLFVVFILIFFFKMFRNLLRK